MVYRCYYSKAEYKTFLGDDIIESVKIMSFIYMLVENIDEGIEILTGIKAGKRNKDGLIQRIP